jgi:hypothetical protein
VLINRKDVGWGRKKVPYKYPRRVTPHEAAKFKKEKKERRKNREHNTEQQRGLIKTKKKNQQEEEDRNR